MAAHNEEDVIRDKVENCLNLDFGEAEWEVIVVSDGSSDATNTILSEFVSPLDRLRIITYHPRAGKANALKMGVAQATGEVIIFTDANVILDQKAPRELLAPFKDLQVGGVCAQVTIGSMNNEEIAGESLYMRFERMLQVAESKLWSMIGVDGALFALRRELFNPTISDYAIILDDFALAMEVVLAGKRLVYADKACAMERATASVANEFKRKLRIVSGGFQYLALQGWRLGQLKIMVWFQLISHKLLHWFSPLLMLVILVSSMALLNRPFFKWFLIGQLAFYTLAMVAHLNTYFRKIYLFYIPYYFCMVNVAALIGMIHFFNKQQGVLWEKVKR